MVLARGVGLARGRGQSDRAHLHPLDPDCPIGGTIGSLLGFGRARGFADHPGHQRRDPDAVERRTTVPEPPRPVREQSALLAATVTATQFHRGPAMPLPGPGIAGDHALYREFCARVRLLPTTADPVARFTSLGPCGRAPLTLHQLGLFGAIARWLPVPTTRVPPVRGPGGLFGAGMARRQ